MTTLAEIEHDLPWGFHDGYLESLAIDYLARSLTLGLRLPVSKRQDVERRARVTVTGLVFCSIDPPGDDGDDYPPILEGGLEMDAGEGPAKGATDLPKLPEGVFLHHIYVANWNYRAIHIAGADARFEWTGEAQPRLQGEGAFFPGDEVPDPT